MGRETKSASFFDVRALLVDNREATTASLEPIRIKISMAFFITLLEIVGRTTLR